MDPKNTATASGQRKTEAELTSKMESRCWGIAVAQFHKGHEGGAYGERSPKNQCSGNLWQMRGFIPPAEI